MIIKRTIKPRLKDILDRHDRISKGEAEIIQLPKFKKYVVCNLRGGIGKTTLVFNLSFETDDILIVDTCPQGNLSYFYDNNYYVNNSTTVKDLILPYIIPGLGSPSRVAKSISATNPYFLQAQKNAYYIASSNDLYMLPMQISTAMNQAISLIGQQRTDSLDSILFSLNKETDREMNDIGLSKCLIDTSPFFSGATHLSWHTTDALIVPVRTDQQSINSLDLLLYTLSNPNSEFSRTLPSNKHSPKIQLIVLTHCAWSTRSGARNEPNQQTKVYIEKVRDIIARNIQSFTTNNPDNHIMLLDDFLGTGRISTALSKPVSLFVPGESTSINRVKTTVNDSVEKIQHQLNYISKILW